MKESLGHGNFLPWIEAESAMSNDTAGRFMAVARMFGDQNPHAAEFPATVPYQLAAPSTPEHVRDEFLREAEAKGGATLTCGTTM